MIVKGESPVLDQSSKLYKWDSSVRKYYNLFEVNMAGLGKGINMLYKNPVTSMRDPI